MSDLGGGSAARASNNGGARTGGPVPVSGGAQIRTPQMIMRDREAREQRRMEESRQAEEEQKRRQAEERRTSAERRAAAIPGAVPRFSNTSSQYSPDVSAPQVPRFDSSSGDQRRSSRIAGDVAGANMLGDPTSRASQDLPSRPAAQDYASGRARGPALSQQDQPRPAPATTGATRRTQPQQATRTQATTAGAQPSSSAHASTAATAPGEGSQRGTASSFPHAFERWETLSSHWEGLTSYWLHKLEQNTEDIRETVPNASTLNRQITDLSAAGANLFHAVVELQRLRASSERKFQRWFFETRADNERNREIQAGMERQLKVERQAREDAARNTTDNSIAVENAKREVSEMRRELMISKDEARRAWEELGRRNQESLDTAQSLKEGRVTLVAGVQVVPYFGGPASRTGSASQGPQRPVTRDGPSGYASTGLASQAAAAGMQSPGDEREYYRHDAASPTNTDPFTDSGRQQPPSQSLAQGSYHPQSYQQGHGQDRTPTSAATMQTAIPASSSPCQQVTPSQYPAASSPAQQRIPQPSVSTSEAQRYYQQGSQPAHTAPGASVPRTTAILPREEVRFVGEGSYGGSNPEIGTEYALDGRGEVQYDERGNPIIFRQRGQPQPARSSASEEDFDTEEAVRRERDQAAQFHGGLIPEAPSVPSNSAAAMATYTPATAGGGGGGSSGGAESTPDYEGEGYDDYQQYVPRHHHPTRLSDVLEEEEERSSRRTMD
ncbi:hypothetical protein CLAFUW4_14646 [Fulvia fulva]|uniref:Uncharacterized protein n=1 Tax=Passalora fulva TaxID=5499 RepID=A0A9Q8PM13_PASFU|nr:uncharacterized protein CLAFUR5_14474 [Fulvia fulva]KAK4609054.1 hypothetical protein CLAFUR4_14640 [Fulvia fulva]KAK4609547.1 hypothetical protein CLAFUR0_14639 [Fulvia fulva]UJO24948.1 hypothetical protein CLAFUR5_14474 [Fulvia fulva]WPV22678.1 hypothetical protein CLAFUW4_14646 [Fulvia fulva]WPV37771.1 hypothetical protein CLAFUW7_14649 [Fulvia fulva]